MSALDRSIESLLIRIYSTNILFNVPMKNHNSITTYHDRKFIHDPSITKMMKKDFPELVAPNFYLDIYTFTWMISHWIMFVETYIEHENNTFMRLPTRKIFYLGVCNNKVYSDSLD